jgi:hypothetical protein
MARSDVDPSEQAAARRHGRRTILVGLGVEAVTLGVVAVSALVEAKDSMVAGTAFLLGWIVTGFGVGESLFGKHLRLVTMLLALLIGIAGIVFNFWVIRQLGYDLKAH